MSSSTPNFPKLNNSNYSEWKDNMKAWLQRSGVWRIVIGEEVRPESNQTAELSAWWQRSDRAAGEMKLMVENDQRIHFQGVDDNPAQIWIKLATAHVSKRPAMRFNAYADFFAIRKREDESLTALMTRIDQNMQNIRNLRPTAFSISDMDDELVSMAMITSLPADYQSFRSSLLLLDQVDRSTLQEAFRNEEANRLRDQINSSTSQALSVSASSSSQIKRCTFCLRTGHLEEECFKRRAAMEQAQKPRPQRRAPNSNTESAGNASLRSTSLSPNS